jgi:hypothetical protein
MTSSGGCTNTTTMVPGHAHIRRARAHGVLLPSCPAYAPTVKPYGSSVASSVTPNTALDQVVSTLSRRPSSAQSVLPAVQGSGGAHPPNHPQS